MPQEQSCSTTTIEATLPFPGRSFGVELFEHHQLVGTESKKRPFQKDSDGGIRFVLKTDCGRPAPPKKLSLSLSVTLILRAFVKLWFVAPRFLRVSCPFATKHLG